MLSCSHPSYQYSAFTLMTVCQWAPLLQFAARCVTCQLDVGIIIQSLLIIRKSRAPRSQLLSSARSPRASESWVCVTSGSARSRHSGPVSHFLAPSSSSSIIKANGARYFEPAIWAPLISDLKTIAGDWATPSGHLQWPGEFSWEATEHCSSIPQSCGFFRRQFAIYAAICNLFLNGKT